MDEPIAEVSHGDGLAVEKGEDVHGFVGGVGNKIPVARERGSIGIFRDLAPVGALGVLDEEFGGLRNEDILPGSLQVICCETLAGKPNQYDQDKECSLAGHEQKSVLGLSIV